MKVKALADLIFNGAKHKGGSVFEVADPSQLLEFGFVEIVEEAKEEKKPAPKKAAAKTKKK